MVEKEAAARLGDADGPGVVGALAADEAAVQRARDLAAELALPLITAADETRVDAVLVVRTDRLELREARRPDRGRCGGGPAGGGRSGGATAGAIACDFVSGPFGHRVRAGHVGAEALVKAVRGRGRSAERAMTVVDATAGLGRDAALLALAGFNVTAIERSAVIAALLRDGLRRAESTLRTAELAGRLRVHVADARRWLATLPDAERPDVVTLDPMFPPRSGTALVKKEMRLCRLVAGAADEAEAAELLAVARQVARRRVVVKRPAYAAPLAGVQPTVSRKGRTIRYDIYTTARD